MNTYKKRILRILLILIVAINIAATAFLFVKVYNCENQNCEIKYMLYIGLNDKDTYKQEISESDAKSIVQDVCSKYVDGYTVEDAAGMWVDENQNDTHENTIVCIFYDTDEDTIHKIADELRIELNQNSILIEKDEIQKEYYNGTAYDVQ